VAAFHPSLPRFAEVIPQRRGALGKGRLAIIGVALGVAPLLAVGYDLADRKGMALEIPIASIIAITLVLLRVSHLCESVRVQKQRFARANPAIATSTASPKPPASKSPRKTRSCSSSTR